MKARWTALGLVVAAALGLTWAYGELAETVYRFKLEAPFTFDQRPFTAIGYMECTYRRALVPNNRFPVKGPPVYAGYYTDTFREAASVVLPDGKGAILFRHGGSCPPLPEVQNRFAKGPESASAGTWLAYYFPDRNDPKTVWILRDRRPPHREPGRLVLNKYLWVSVNEPVSVSLAQNVPIAWKWYEEYSAKYRKAMSGGGGSTESQDAIWRGIFACVMREDEWRNQREFAEAVAGIISPSVVSLNRAGSNVPRDCSSRAAPADISRQISLVPSDDSSKATLDLDRTDLRWAVITVPYNAAYQDRATGRWTPEICLANDGCTGIRLKTPFWIYLPNQRVFARLDEEWLETFRFSGFALRPGDGL